MATTKTSKMTVNLDGLDHIRKGLDANFVAKVGILASGKPQGNHPGISNVELGIVHELGSEDKGIPPRSFLRMPIELKRDMLIKFLGRAYIKRLIEEGKIFEVMEQLGMKAEEVVNSAFLTGGFGQWPANSPATIAMKGSSSPLINTRELSRAVTSEAAKRSEL